MIGKCSSKITPRPIFGRRVGLLVFSGFLVSALIAASALIVIWTSHRSATFEWRERISGLAMMIGGHAKQTIEATDDILLEVVKSLNSMDFSTVEELSAAVRSENFHRQLADRIKGAPHIELLSVISRDGFVISNSLRHVPPYRFSQWDSLKEEILDDETDRIFSSVFVTSLQKRNEPIIGLGRKVFAKSGQVMAIVGAGVKTSYFSSFYASLPMRDGYIVSLLNRRGIHLAGFGKDTPPLGQKTPYVEFDAQLRDGNIAVFVSQNSHDQLGKGKSERLVAMVRVPEISMVATVSISSTVYLVQWRQSAIYFGFGGVGFTLLMIFLTLAVRRLYKEIEEARQTAVASDGAKTRFLSAISHEIRTPLNAIRGSAEVLLDEKPPLLARKYAQEILQASRRLSSMVNNTLDFARLEVGKYSFQERVFELRPVLDTIIRITRSLPGADKLHIELTVAENVPRFLDGASDVLKQVVMNLLSNAVKFTDEGSVKLIVAYDDKAGTLFVKVKDTGRGIPQSEHGNIFTAFERGRAAGDVIGGAGLGLTIAKHLIDGMGGRICFFSSGIEGTCFAVEMPMRIPAPGLAASAKVDPKSRSASISLRILVAEDVPANRLVIEAQLRKFGHSCHLVTNGLEALDAIRTGQFDAVLMDVQMPLMDGLTATRAIRQMPAPAGMIPIIGVTAVTEAEQFAEMLEAGMDSYITKPIEVEDLLDGLASQCGMALFREPARGLLDVFIEDDELQAAYLEDLQSERDELAACLDDDAARKLILHKLRGLAANFGKVQLAQLAADAERSLLQADAQAVLDAVDALIRDSLSSAPRPGSG